MRLFEVAGAGVARDTDIIFQVLDSVVPDGAGSYLAAPISTGRRYFEALAEYKVRDLPGLIATIGEAEYLRLVRWPNVEDGEALAMQLRHAGVPHLINTGPIFIKEWRGRDYMNLCLKLIERKVQRAYFHPDWAYSAGAVEEFVFCAQHGLTLLTSEGKSLTLQAALTALASVRSYLQSFFYPTDFVEQQMAGIGTLIDSRKYCASIP